MLQKSCEIKDDSDSIEDEQQKISYNQHSSQISSIYYEQYKELMDIQINDISRSIQLFHKARIIYNPYKRFRKFQYQLLNISKCENILEIRSFIGFFDVELIILIKFDKKNPFKNIKSSSKGSFGQIYFFNFYGNELAFKIIQNNKKLSIQENFSRKIHQITMMRIVSALECTVRLQRYLGFDAILYEGQIMFAMQRGKKVYHAPPILQKDLKKSLQILHCYGIIHFDIKPQNMLYSPYYGKNVFIDLGLSTIVKQIIGFKSQISFRGTPKFCGQQMISLLCDPKIYAFVDVYNNDLYCLRQSINFLQAKTQKTEKSQEENGNILTQVEQNQINMQLQLFMFRYFYVCDRMSTLRKIIDYQNKKIFKFKAKEVLEIIYESLSMIFNKSIFKQLENWSYLRQYQNIQKFIQVKNQKLSYFYLQNFPEDQIHQKQQKYSSFYQFLMKISKKGGFQVQKSYFFNLANNLSRFKVSKNNLQHEDMMFLFQCLRFDKKNIKYRQKLKVSKNFREFFNEDLQISINSTYSDIAYFFLYLLKRVILASPFNQLKASSFYRVIYQLIVLGVPISNEMQQFIELSNIKYKTITQKAIIYFSFHKINDLILSINLTLETKKYYIQIYRLIKNLIKNLKQEILTKIQIKNRDQQCIIIILKEMSKIIQQKNRVQYLNNYYQYGQKIRNPTLRKLIRKMYSIMCFFYEVLHCEHELIIDTVKSFTSNFKFANLYTMMIMVKKYAISLDLNHDFIQFNKKLKKIIDCEEIYSRFNFNRMQIMMVKHKIEKEKIFKYINDINNCYQQYVQLEQPINSEIYQILLKIQIQELGKNDLAIIKQLFSKIQEHIEPNQDKMSFKYYLNIFENIKLLKLFKKFDFKSNYLDLQTTKNQVAHCLFKLKSENDKQKYLILAKTFKQLVYLTQYFQDQLHPKQLLSTYIKLQHISRHLHLKQIWFCSLYSLILISNTYRQLEIFDKYVQLIYDMIINTKQLSPFIYVQSQCNQLCMHLSYFSKQCYLDKLYTLMKYIIQWIQKNPFDSYLKVFTSNMDAFCRIYHDRIIYQQLNKYIPFSMIRINPYLILYYINSIYFQKIQIKLRLLKMISLYIKRLSKYAKKVVLVKYYFIALTIPYFSSQKITNIYFKYGKKFISSDRYQNFIKIFQNKLGKKYVNDNIVLKTLYKHKLNYLQSI